MNIVKEIIKRILIGIAYIIPGVSGGTMAVSMSVYDKIISAITGLIIGSSIAIIYKAGISYVSIWRALVTVVTFGIGFAITFLLGKDGYTESHR